MEEISYFSILTLLYLFKVVCTGTHSFWYFVTLTAGPSPFPEMVIVGMVDDVPVEYYDSVDRKMTLWRHWLKEEGDVADAQMKHMAIADTTHSLKSRLQFMTEHLNHSVTLHTYQRIAGCELDDDGTARFQAKDAYNGKDVLSYNVQDDTWSTPFPELQKGSWLMESYKGLNNQFYQPLCIHILKGYLHQEQSILKQRVSPRIRVLRKQVGSAGGIEVTCLATGFYSRHIELTLQRDKQPVLEERLIRGDILPNCDGTYQQRMRLSVSAEELREGHTYTCSVRHVSMDNKLDVTWDSQQKTNIGLISGAVAAALCIVLLIFTGLFIWRRIKSNDSKSGKNEEEGERINVAEGPT